MGSTGGTSAGDPDSPGSDVAALVAACPVSAWSGEAWRCHSSRYRGDDAGGSLRVTGRHHRGSDRFPDSAWPALYTGLALHVALGERLRHTTPQTLATLRHQRISRLRVRLAAVVDLCGDAGCQTCRVAGWDLGALCQPLDYRLTHRIAAAARSVAEGMIVPSCTRFPEGNLIVFPDRLRPGSTIEVVDSLDPDLVVDWDNPETWRPAGSNVRD